MPERLPKWLGLLFASLFVLSVLVTLLALRASERGKSGAAGPSVEEATRVLGGAAGRERPRAAVPSTVSAIDLAPTVRDFWLPGGRDGADPIDGTERGPCLFRERTGRWSDEQVNRFWISPRKIAEEIQVRENDAHVQELFEDIP